MSPRADPPRPVAIYTDYGVLEHPVLIMDDGTCWSLERNPDGRGTVWHEAVPVPGTWRDIEVRRNAVVNP
jgi:hypothetical protein